MCIGQSRYLYTGIPVTFKAFEEFLCEHIGHPLMFVDHNYDHIFDYEDVTPEEPDSTYAKKP